MKNKLYLFFVFFFMLVIPLSLSLDCSFEENTCDYGEIDWSQVEDFTYVDLSNPNINWGEVILSRIEGEKVSEIPIQHFDPREILEQNLYFASVEQIEVYLLEFENLAYTNPENLAQVFSNKYNVDITFRDNKEIVFDGTFISGDFSSYKPQDFPQHNYKQIIDDGEVKIIPLDNEGNELPNYAFSVKGAEEFTKDEDGNLNLVLGDDEAILEGIQKGKVTLDDGTIIEYENNENGKFTFSSNGDFSSTDGDVKIDYVDKDEPIELKGRFDKTNGIYNLKPYNGKQSVYIDNNFPDTPLSVGTRGEEISIYTDGEEHEGNYVSYLDDIYRLNGAGALYTANFQVQSNNKDSYFEEIDGKTKAKGILKYNNENLIYDGLCETAIFTREVIDGEEIVDVDADNDLEDAIVARITKTNLKYAHLIEEDFINDANNMVFDIKRKNNKLDIEYDITSIGRLTEVYDDPYAFLLLNKGLKINIVDTDISMTINPDLGVVYNNGVNEPVNIISPERSFHLTGTDLEILTDIVETVIEEKSTTVDTQIKGLIRMFDMNVDSDKSILETFENIKQFISENYEDGYAGNVVKTAFMVDKISELYFLSPDEFSNEEGFVIDQFFSDIKEQIYNDEVLKDFFSSFIDSDQREDNFDDLNFVGEIDGTTRYNDISSIHNSLNYLIENNPEDADFYKELMQQHFLNLIFYEERVYEHNNRFFENNNEVIETCNKQLYSSNCLYNLELERSSLQSDQTNVDIPLIYNLNPRNTQGIINAYRGLLFLEGHQIVDGEIKPQTKISDKEVEYAIYLSREYNNQMRYGEAISILDGLNLENLDPDLGVGEVEYLKQSVKSAREAYAQSSLYLIQTELTGVQRKVLDIISRREGSIEQISEIEGIGNQIVAGLFIGDRGRDLLNSLRISENVKKDAKEFEFELESQIYGLNTLNLLLEFGASPEQINSWIDVEEGRNHRNLEEFTARLILEDSNLFEIDQNFDPDTSTIELGDVSNRNIITYSDDEVSFIYEGQRYVVDGDNFDEIYGFLNNYENRYNVRSLVEQSAYADEIQVLIGANKIPSSEDYVPKNLQIDTNSNNLIRERLDDLDLGFFENLFYEIDSRTSPAMIAAVAASKITVGQSLTLAGMGKAYAQYMIVDMALDTVDELSGGYLTPEGKSALSFPAYVALTRNPNIASVKAFYKTLYSTGKYNIKD